MSVSPQSLARTRDKRVPKIPARFDDFSEIPSEVICRNAIAEALTRSKSKRHCDENRNENQNYVENHLNSPFHPSVTFSTNAPIRRRPPAHKGTRRMVLPPTAFMNTEERITLKREPEEAKSKSASLELDGLPPQQQQQQPPAAPTLTHDIEESVPYQFLVRAPRRRKPPAFKGTRGIQLPPSAFTTDEERQAYYEAYDAKYIQPQRSTSLELDGQPQQPPSPTHDIEVSRPNKLLRRIVIPSEDIIGTHSLNSEDEPEPAPSVLESQPPPPATAAAVPVPPLTKTATAAPLADDKSKSSSSSKKKKKGLSLIKTNESLQVQSNGNLVNPNPQQPPIQVPQNAKLFSSLPHNMKYGTRLMLNEPIYLPRSVATIAPITRTYQQMANQLRKPPFLSEKAEACLSYQEERKLNYILSTHSALARITKYLSTRDLVNLRAVNKTWKSIVDSDALWKRVVFESGLRIDWQLLFLSVINRFNTTELVLNNYTGKAENSSESTLALAAATVSHAKILTQLLLPWDGHPRSKSLEHVRIRTTGPEQNSFAFALILFLFFHQTRQNQREKMLEVTWQVRILIDPDGWGKFPIIPEYAKRVEKLITPDFFQQNFSNVYLKDLPASIDNDEKSTGHLMIDFCELKEAVESVGKNKASFHLEAI